MRHPLPTSPGRGYFYTFLWILFQILFHSLVLFPGQRNLSFINPDRSFRLHLLDRPVQRFDTDPRLLIQLLPRTGNDLHLPFRFPLLNILSQIDHQKMLRRIKQPPAPVIRRTVQLIRHLMGYKPEEMDILRDPPLKILPIMSSLKSLIFQAFSNLLPHINRAKSDEQS